jgi:energy-coupling factor transporter transmembrane protein EcfT
MEKQIETISFKKGLFIGAILAICVILLIADFIYMGVIGAIPTLIKFILETKFIGFAFIVVFVIIVLFFVNFIKTQTLEKKVDRYDTSIKNHKQGRDGEDKVVDIMREALDGSSHIFRNCVLPGQKEDIDIIWVSSQGVFVFEVKNYNGKYENVQEDWFYYKTT